LLLEFHKDYRKAAQEITEALSKAQTEYVQRRAHTIKGVAATIGAKDLMKNASALEEALIHDTGGDKQTLLADLAGSLDKTLESIGAVLAPADDYHEEEPEVEVGRNVDLEKVGPLMGELMGLLEEGDAGSEECFEAFRDDIKISACNEDVDELKEQIDSYDFENARNTLMKLAKCLNILLEDVDACQR